MDEATARIALNEWLVGALERLLAPRPDAREFLDRAIDHADLERRMRALRHGTPHPLFR